MSSPPLSNFGHRLLVEPSSIVLSSKEQDLLSELRPLSFIFRARNFNFKAPYSEWLEQFGNLITQIKAAVGHHNLLLSIDHEGGRVIRPPSPITRFPYAAKWGTAVEDVSKAMAIELRSLGLNTVWAPVADVLTCKDSKAIGLRSFGDNPEYVVKQVSAMARVLEENGIAAAAKHFPGHGPVEEDTHYQLPTSKISQIEWQETHLPPFAKLISDGIRFIMTAHIVYPALDPLNQATLSSAILNELLRSKLGFKGLVVADALGMGAIRDEIDSSSTILKSLQATVDLFCVAGDTVDLLTAKSIAENIRLAVERNEISEATMSESKDRILATIATLSQSEPVVLDQKVFEKHAALAIQLDPDGEWMNYQFIPKGFD